MPIANYGYKNGSGDYFISIDTDLCTACNDCIEVCPSGVLEIVEDELDPLGDELVVIVTEMHRKKIKYSCMPCKSTEKDKPPCIEVCSVNAIVHSW
ncbi:MAG: 4Fe-4S binding protein [Candidatus Kariarchaeaceae archaeon]|jgi:NAD-dependent dihydropyrimidine dehydrogenase PreA subunit